MKRASRLRRHVLFTVGVMAGALAMPFTAYAQAPIVIKFSHVVAENTPKGQGALKFKELAEKKLPGKVEVQVFPSSQLFGDAKEMEAVLLGDVQLIAPSLSKFDRYTKKLQVFDLPFMFSSTETLDKFQSSKEGQELLTSMKSKGLLGLAYWHNGMKQLSGPVAMREPDDARGLKFRIMESDVLQAQVQAIGGNPQKMAFGEVYQALQTGAIDAQENTWSNSYSSKFYEVQPYFMESNHGYLGYLVAVNPRFWTGLPDEIRAGLEEIMAEVTAWGNAQSAAINAESLAKIETSGRAEVIRLSPEELASWQQAMRPVWDEFAGVIGTDIIAAAQPAD